MLKTDFKKQLGTLYSVPHGGIVLLEVPRMNFVMVDGSGDPNTSEGFTQAVEAVYGVSYGIKFMAKRDLGQDYVVMPLEGLWWTDSAVGFDVGEKDDWMWTTMIMQPAFITDEMFRTSVCDLRRKKPEVSRVDLRFDAFDEGASAQIMHIGPFSEEGPTVERLHRFIAGEGYEPRGRHHEIYMSDPRRVAPEKRKTIIRQPVKPIG